MYEYEVFNTSLYSSVCFQTRMHIETLACLAITPHISIFCRVGFKEHVSRRGRAAQRGTRPSE